MAHGLARQWSSFAEALECRSRLISSKAPPPCDFWRRTVRTVWRVTLRATLACSSRAVGRFPGPRERPVRSVRSDARRSTPGCAFSAFVQPATVHGRTAPDDRSARLGACGREWCFQDSGPRRTQTPDGRRTLPPAGRNPLGGALFNFRRPRGRTIAPQDNLKSSASQNYRSSRSVGKRPYRARR